MKKVHLNIPVHMRMHTMREVFKSDNSDKHANMYKHTRIFAIHPILTRFWPYTILLHGGIHYHTIKTRWGIMRHFVYMFGQDG